MLLWLQHRGPARGGPWPSFLAGPGTPLAEHVLCLHCPPASESAWPQPCIPGGGGQWASSASDQMADGEAGTWCSPAPRLWESGLGGTKGGPTTPCLWTARLTEWRPQSWPHAPQARAAVWVRTGSGKASRGRSRGCWTRWASTRARGGRVGAGLAPIGQDLAHLLWVCE